MAVVCFEGGFRQDTQPPKSVFVRTCLTPSNSQAPSRGNANILPNPLPTRKGATAKKNHFSYFYQFRQYTKTNKRITAARTTQHYNIGQEALSQIFLHFPEMAEQRRIADLLLLVSNRIALCASRKLKKFKFSPTLPLTISIPMMRARHAHAHARSILGLY